jgi:hypothetical protein
VPNARKAVAKKRKQKTVQNSEKCLHFHCQSWLEKSGIWNKLLIFHVPNERKGGIGAIMHFKRLGVRKGVADYLAFASDCRALAIELKDDEGDQDADQIKFQRKWEAAGNSYVVARTLEEFQNALQWLVLFN